MGSVYEINELNFDEEVLQAATPVLLDFTATWCAPCRSLSVLLEELARERGQTLKVAKVDVDDAPALAARYGVRGTPTLLLIENGREVRRQVGAGTRRSLQALVAV